MSILKTMMNSGDDDADDDDVDDDDGDGDDASMMMWRMIVMPREGAGHRTLPPSAV